MREVDLLVVGAGPAGLGAAIEARRYGAQVIIADDQDKPGGQLLKQIHKFFGSKVHQAGIRGFRIGLDLLSEADALGVDIRLSTKALGIFDEKIVSLITRDDEVLAVKPRNIVLATGGIEKALAFPGWTLPGVITAGAAQTMCNIERVLPGEKIIMIGSGNVGLIVSYQLLQAGAEVVAVVEADTKIGGYAVHADKMRRSGVPLYMGHTIKQARGTECVEEVEIIALDKEWRPIEGTEKSFKVDTVCVSVGLNPNTRLAGLAGCRMEYFTDLGGFLPLHDCNMESSIKGIYVAGDLAGIEEANTALDEGRLAGISAAASLGYLKREQFSKLKGDFLSRLSSLRSGPFGYDRYTAKRDITSKLRGKTLTALLPEIRPGGETPGLKHKTDSTGIYSLKELKNLPGYPSWPRIKRGVVASIECAQKIPCDPCVDSCPSGAITIGNQITDLPVLNEDKCTGCGLCIASCPGQAIFLLNYNYSDSKAAVSFPYEYLPLPEVGDILTGVNRKGEAVAPVEIVKVDKKARNDHTTIITASMSKEYVHHIRSIKSEVH